MAAIIHVPRDNALRVGIIGDRRKRPPEKNPPKKQTFILSGAVKLELDLKYAPVRVLGNGSYGVVCSCINRETNEPVAVKKITGAFLHVTTALRTLREIQILRQIRHENVISLKDVMLSSSSNDVYLVNELMECDLGHVIASTKLTPDHHKVILFQILRGIKYLHSADVIHRDLKPQNILVNRNLDVKICDFGLARTKYEEAQPMTEYVATRWYRAPELLTGSTHYGNSVDMWSAGCVFAEILGQNPIFPGKDSLSQICMIHHVLGTQADLSFVGCLRAKQYMEHLPYSAGVSFQRLYPEADPLAVDLLKKLLVLDPRKRLSASRALEHPYFAGVYDSRRDGSAPVRVRLGVDENPEGVDKTLIRDLVWKEMVLYHPEEKVYKMF